ncbi:hypothetical protein QWY84_00115 [Aquisalimonas lutea]|uniref:hypothetical protein n=1 Tax=Aquisalimonas lutea TaxID=1327750 RepID=UPI0025B3E0A8|nr:hypothetical protein [Aquisalimonas lutea]MDN3516001.1 hypothetical protein [Aquisalimonas lutea]
MRPTKRIFLYAVSVLIPICVLLCVYALYLPGLASGFQFDDNINLRALEEIGSSISIAEFIFSGQAGPLGRPIALASFVPQADAWPDNARPFLLANVLLHLLNGVAVGSLAYLLLRASGQTRDVRKSYWIAVGAAAIWLCLPLLASSNLFIVQRMTTLAAFWVLSGLCLHVTGRRLVEDRPSTGLGLMSLGTCIGLGLGVFTKENAAVFPLLVLVLDRTLFSHRIMPDAYRWWRYIFAITPTVMIALYMLYRLVDGGGYDIRHFTLLERMFTQGVVLFDYLRLMLLPNSASFTPFGDGYPLFGGLPVMAAALVTIAWFAAAVGAVVAGPRWPVPSFAILWFLGAHLLESTWIPLELYYEHRNYLPSVGIIIAFLFAIGRLQGLKRNLAIVGVVGYAVVLGLSLVQVTTLWGTPRIAAELWWDRNPSSARAAQHLAQYHQREQNPLAAIHVLDESAQRQPNQMTLPLRALRITCELGRDSETRRRFEEIRGKAATSVFINHNPSGDTKTLSELFSDVQSNRCGSLTPLDIRSLAKQYLANSSIQASDTAAANVHIILARVAYSRDKGDRAMEHLFTALRKNATVNTAEHALRLAEEHQRPEWVRTVIEILDPLCSLAPWQYNAELCQLIANARQLVKRM